MFVAREIKQTLLRKFSEVFFGTPFMSQLCIMFIAEEIKQTLLRKFSEFFFV